MSGLNREVSIEFETPDVFHELPLHLPAEVLDAALWELAEKIWPAGTEFQRETTALVYADLTDTLVADGVMYASLGLFETEDGEVSTANLIARVESVDGEEPAVVAASVQEELALQEHRDVHQVDLPCGPAVLSFHSTEIDGDSALSSLAFAHVELYVPSSVPGWLAVLSLSTPSFAELPRYVGWLRKIGETFTFRLAAQAEEESPTPNDIRSVFG
ncbi:hypothetical protein YWIDRAFT_01969 [Streptomyces sp. SceaMP-e96]|uniref:hypothetical protein n=1 Tax=Streptomyces TaxID=1883 RepID=UPI000823C090|nr:MULTISPECIES: hypothetical protein [unclassified Streptomyces]MYT12691.1 hypothetical protein [Streptomyces sp. SID4951]SCK38025.1 hypothetical protein YWIDRAFT_01969 [Streptomyces sp. SceaMP-e96]